MLWQRVCFLFLGTAGALFIVPLNALIQQTQGNADEGVCFVGFTSGALAASMRAVLANPKPMLLWAWLRLPETLHPEYRRSLNWRVIGAGIRATLSERQSLGYTVALTALFGGLTAYIASIQQIVFDTYQAPQAIGLVFAGIAAPMALASWFNAHIVVRFGIRPVGHVGIMAFAAIAAGHALLAASIDEPLWLFAGLQSLAMCAFASSRFHSAFMLRMFCAGFVWKPASLSSDGITV